jgi:ribonuclease HI
MPIPPTPGLRVKHVQIFTDGACKGNPGKGGWGALLRMGEHEKEMAGSEKETTNNRMELMGAIKALEALTQPCQVTLHTDSKYVLDGITKWVFGWQKNGWKTADRNRSRTTTCGARWSRPPGRTRSNGWVKASDGHPENERVDRLASDAAQAA